MLLKTRLICNKLLDNCSVVAQETPPGRRNVRIENKIYYLPFPYTQSVVVKTFYESRHSLEAYYFCSKNPAKKFDDLHQIPLPNFYELGNVCLASKNVDDFWTSRFSFSLLYNVVNFMRANFQDHKNLFNFPPKTIEGFFAWWEQQPDTSSFKFVKQSSFSIIKKLDIFGENG